MQYLLKVRLFEINIKNKESFMDQKLDFNNEIMLTYELKNGRYEKFMTFSVRLLQN